MENQLTEKESLELIGKMINSAKNNLQKGTGKIFLLWGYLTLFVSLSNLILFILLPESSNYYSFCVWLGMPIGAFFHFRLIRKMTEEEGVRTYIEQLLSYVWIAFSMAVVTLVGSMILATIPSFFHRTWNFFEAFYWVHWMFLIPFMLILYGFALFVSGKAYQFKPMVWGALVCWLTTIVIFLLYGTNHFMEMQLVALMISVIAGYIIPGHLLAKKENGTV
jgi:hypothetical protein